MLWPALAPGICGACKPRRRSQLPPMPLLICFLVVLLAIVWAADAASSVLRRQRVRRAVEGSTGVVMLGFAGALAAEA